MCLVPKFHCYNLSCDLVLNSSEVAAEADNTLAPETVSRIYCTVYSPFLCIIHLTLSSHNDYSFVRPGYPFFFFFFYVHLYFVSVSWVVIQ